MHFWHKRPLYKGISFPDRNFDQHIEWKSSKKGCSRCKIGFFDFAYHTLSFYFPKDKNKQI